MPAAGKDIRIDSSVASRRRATSPNALKMPLTRSIVLGVITSQVAARLVSFHTNADTTVPADNSVFYYLALRNAGVPAEMHIFEKGAHGVGLANEDPALSE
jgi:hypothetical protein